MNFNQGMRRLAVFAGILGAIAGGFHAYKELQDIPAERFQHKVFEELAASDDVTKEQTRLRAEEKTRLRAGIEVSSVPWSEVNGERIKTIFWNRDFSVYFFEMEDGGDVSSEPSPSAWTYLLGVVFPALGFFIPWGAIRAIGWVGDGFIQTRK